MILLLNFLCPFRVYGTGAPLFYVTAWDRKTQGWYRKNAQWTEVWNRQSHCWTAFGFKSWARVRTNIKVTPFISLTRCIILYVLQVHTHAIAIYTSSKWYKNFCFNLCFTTIYWMQENPRWASKSGPRNFEPY